MNIHDMQLNFERERGREGEVEEEMVGLNIHSP
jgi:hypothetical protein